VYNKSMNIVQERLDKFCEDNRVKALYIFGSRATETLELLQGSRNSFSKSESDLDIAILASLPLSVSEKVDFTINLGEIFGVSRVDLLILNDADPFVAANAIRGNRLYASDSYEVDEYELFVLRRAGDLAGFERERMAMILRDS
jgi:predicted nucleotidyltransferase